MPRFTDADYDAIAETFVRGPFTTWDQTVNGLTSTELFEVERRLASAAERYSRASAYVSRRMSANHADAVKRQNQAARKVRQALGYTYADDAITF